MNDVSDKMPDRPYKKNSFAAMHPDLMEEYDPSNTIDPFQMVCSSRAKVLWSHMDNPKHTWWASFEQRHKGVGKCPYCDDRELLPGFNSLKVRFPDTAKNWSPKNKKSADHYLPQSKEKVIWDCPDCHGEYTASVCSVFLQTFNCPYCNDRKALPGFNTIAARHPTLAKQWSPNNTLGADLVLAKSTQPGEWICPDCGNTYFAAPIDVVSGLSKCPHCNEKYAVPGYEFLALVYPELAEALIGLTNNSPNGEVTQASEMCDWRCPECHAVYSAYMKDAMLDARAGRKTCPYCKGKVLLSGVNSLDIQHPNVAKLWSHRNEKKANEVLPKSKEIGHWICPECYNEYEATIVSMTSGEMECPYCDLRRNSFARKHTDLLLEWDFVNNYVLAYPDQILESCDIPVWWTCSENPEHEYTMSPAKRILFQKRRKKSCPYCKGRRRKKRHFI